MIAESVRANRLWEKHPGLRLYGFDHPGPVDETGFHGYGSRVTVPEGMYVPPPVRKHLTGGTYAAHMIPMGSFEEWAWLYDRVRNSDGYGYAGHGDPENMYDALEERLNDHDHALEASEGEPQTERPDLLIPVRRKAR